MFGGVADLLHRGDHLADHGLQLAEEAVEALGDRTQLVGTVAVQAAGQVAFALGDVVEHGDHLPERPGDAVADQPDHRQAEGGDQQADQGHAEDVPVALIDQFALQLLQLAEHRGFRKLQHQGPARVAASDLERQVQLDVAVVGVDIVGHLVDLQALQVVHLVLVEHLAGRLAEFARVLGVGHQAAVAGDQRHLAGAVVELPVGGDQQLLDEVEGQVGAGHALELAIDQDRRIERGEHDHLAVQFVWRRVDHAVALVLSRAQVVLALAHAGGQQLLAFEGVAERFELEAAIGAVPPGHEAAAGVMARLVGIQVVAAVEGIGLPTQVGIEQLGVGVGDVLQQVDQLLAAGGQLRGAGGVGLADQRIGLRQVAGDGHRVVQFALDLADLGAGQGGQALLDHLAEQPLGALLHQALGARAGEQRIEHQGSDHGQHAGTGQGGDGKLDGFEFHGAALPRGMTGWSPVIGARAKNP
ncbi:hypothetical protein FQZ97_569090 [compost metagenome]